MTIEKYVVFRLGGELYAVSISEVERILPEQKATRIPGMPESFLGVIDMRGRSVPAIDLRVRLGMEPREEPGMMVVILLPAGPCAWCVDSVEGIHAFEPGDIEEGPAMLRGAGDGFMAGVAKLGSRLVVVVHAAAIIDDEALLAA